MHKPLRMDNENHRVKRSCVGKCGGFIEYYRFKKDALEFAKELQKHSDLCDLILVQKAFKKKNKEVWITLKVFQPLEYYIPRYKDDSERPL